MTAIEEEQYSVVLKNKCIDVEKFSASIKLSAVQPVEVRKERECILRSAATLILMRKRKGCKTDVPAWAALLLTLFRFVSTRNATRDMSAESVAAELYKLVSELDLELPVPK